MTGRSVHGCTDKVRYRTKLDAKIALANTSLRKRTRAGKDESRPYKCEHCFGWHLTSWTSRRHP